MKPDDWTPRARDSFLRFCEGRDDIVATERNGDIVSVWFEDNMEIGHMDVKTGYWTWERTDVSTTNP